MLSGHFLDVVRGLPTLVAHRRAEAQVDRIGAVTERYRRATVDTLRLAFASSSVLELVATLSVALVAVVRRPAAGRRHHRLRDGPGRAAARARGLLAAAPRRRRVPRRRRGHRRPDRGERGAGRPRGRAHRRPGPGSPTLRLDDLAPGHAGAPQALTRPLDLDLPDRGLVAVAGPSGCGKSTLLQTLRGELAAYDGRVLVGGVDLADVDPDWWHRQVAWLPQRPWLAAGTVRDNLRLGGPGADRRGALAGAGRGRAGRRRGRPPRRARPPSSARTAPACRRGSGPGSRWPGCWSPTGPWCCSTSRPPTSTTPPSSVLLAAVRTPGRARAGRRRGPPAGGAGRRRPWWSSCSPARHRGRARAVPVTVPAHGPPRRGRAGRRTAARRLGRAAGHRAGRALHRVRGGAHGDRRLADHPRQRPPPGAGADGGHRGRARPSASPGRCCGTPSGCSPTTSPCTSSRRGARRCTPRSCRSCPARCGSPGRGAVTCWPPWSTTSTPCWTPGCGCASPSSPPWPSGCSPSALAWWWAPQAGAVLARAGGRRRPRRDCWDATAPGSPSPPTCATVPGCPPSSRRS